MFQGENVDRILMNVTLLSLSIILMIPELRFPLYVMYADVRQLTQPKDPEKIARSKDKFCAFVVSNKFAKNELIFLKNCQNIKQLIPAVCI